MNTKIDYRVSASLAFTLLCLQVALPWTAHHLVTQDGPSHLYGAIVAWDLATNAGSGYGSIYRLQAEPVPNWTTTVVLGTLAGIAGPAHAEQLLVSALFIFHFLSVHSHAALSARDTLGVRPLQTP